MFNENRDMNSHGDGDEGKLGCLLIPFYVIKAIFNLFFRPTGGE